MKTLVILVFILISISFFCCTDLKYKVTVDTKLESPVFYHTWLKNDSFDFDFGLSEIHDSVFNGDKLLYIDTCKLFCIDAFISNDTVKLFYENRDCFMTIFINNDNYSIKVQYVTDIANEYKSGNKISGYLKPEIRYHKLILQKINLNLNDTIRGYINMETMPFLKRERNSFDSYSSQSEKLSGYFTIRIKDYKDKKPFTIP